MGKEDFLKKFGGIYEHAEWVAEEVLADRPFESFEHFTCRMRETVEGAEPDEWMELLLAHPDLAGKLGLEKLTENSRREQQGAGLDSLDEEEFELFTGLNEAYREMHGFPFIICVGKTDKLGILRAFGKRLMNRRTAEIATALSEVHEIARLRLENISDG